LAIRDAYPIKLSDASGGSFVASNDSITYVDGSLTVLPQVPLVPARVASGQPPESLKELAPERLLPDPSNHRPMERQFLIDPIEEDM
jgi:hypothetical protein